MANQKCLGKFYNPISNQLLLTNNFNNKETSCLQLRSLTELVSDREGVCQPKGRQSIIWQNIWQKLHKNKRNGTESNP